MTLERIPEIPRPVGITDVKGVVNYLGNLATTLQDHMSMRPEDFNNLKNSLHYVDNLVTSVSQAGATRVTLIIDTTKKISADLTIPSNVGVEFKSGGLLDIDSGYTVTINGSLDAGLYQIFDGDGSVLFGPGSVNEVYPEWWGALFDGSTSDSTSAFHSAISSLTSLNSMYGGGIIRMPAGVTRANVIINTDSITLEGSGVGGQRIGTTIIPYDVTKPGIWVNDGNVSTGEIATSNIKLRDFTVSGGQYGVRLGHTTAQHASGVASALADLTDVAIRETTVAGLHMLSSVNSVHTRIYVENNSGDGIVFDPSYTPCNNVIISGAKIRVNAGYGIKITQGSDHIMIKDGTSIENNSKEGLYINLSAVDLRILTLTDVHIENNCLSSGSYDLYIADGSARINRMALQNSEFLSTAATTPIGIFEDVSLTVSNILLGAAISFPWLIFTAPTVNGGALVLSSSNTTAGVSDFLTRISLTNVQYNYISARGTETEYGIRDMRSFSKTAPDNTGLDIFKIQLGASYSGANVKVTVYGLFTDYGRVIEHSTWILSRSTTTAVSSEISDTKIDSGAASIDISTSNTGLETTFIITQNQNVSSTFSVIVEIIGEPTYVFTTL